MKTFNVRKGVESLKKKKSDYGPSVSNLLRKSESGLGWS